MVDIRVKPGMNNKDLIATRAAQMERQPELKSPVCHPWVNMEAPRFHDLPDIQKGRDLFPIHYITRALTADGKFTEGWEILNMNGSSHLRVNFAPWDLVLSAGRIERNETEHEIRKKLMFRSGDFLEGELVQSSYRFFADLNRESVCLSSEVIAKLEAQAIARVGSKPYEWFFYQKNGGHLQKYRCIGEDEVELDKEAAISLCYIWFVPELFGKEGPRSVGYLNVFSLSGQDSTIAGVLVYAQYRDLLLEIVHGRKARLVVIEFDSKVPDNIYSFQFVEDIRSEIVIDVTLHD